MYLDGYIEHIGYEGFVIDAVGSAVDTDAMCASADELSRTDASTDRKLQLWALFACERAPPGTTSRVAPRPPARATPRVTSAIWTYPNSPNSSRTASA
jgi:hypothetical protein